MSGALLKELQALIAFACYDSPSLIRRGASLPDTAIENVMASIYYGNAKNGADPDLISYDDQLMLGLNKFKGLLYTVIADRTKCILWRSSAVNSRVFTPPQESLCV
jgi:hypothetical protein